MPHSHTGYGARQAGSQLWGSLISLGAFFIGLGEWVNHPLQTGLLPASAHHPAGVLTAHPRSNKPIGLLFVLLGIAVAGSGVYRLV